MRGRRQGTGADSKERGADRGDLCEPTNCA